MAALKTADHIKKCRRSWSLTTWRKRPSLTWCIAYALVTLAALASALVLWLCLTCDDFQRVSFVPPVGLYERHAAGSLDTLHWKVTPQVDYVAMAPYNFSFLIEEQSACQRSTASPHSGQVVLLIAAYTAPADWQRRQVIRQTWGNSTFLSSMASILVFPLGRTLDSDIAARVQHESKTYKDIIQGDFVDSYRNLSYKGILTLQWASRFCSEARFLLKVDIDVFPNIKALVPFLLRSYGNEAHFLGCKVHWRSLALRPGDWCGKWCVGNKEYRPRFYPPYCSGSAYIISGDLLGPLARTARSLPVWWVADVYLTGIVPNILGDVKHIVLRDYMEEDPDYLMTRLKGPGSNSVLLAFVRGPEDIRKAWSILHSKR